MFGDLAVMKQILELKGELSVFVSSMQLELQLDYVVDYINFLRSFVL